MKFQPPKWISRNLPTITAARYVVLAIVVVSCHELRLCWRRRTADPTAGLSCMWHGLARRAESSSLHFGNIFATRLAVRLVAVAGQYYYTTQPASMGAVGELVLRSDKRVLIDFYHTMPRASSRGHA